MTIANGLVMMSSSDNPADRRAIHHTRGGSVSRAKCRCFAIAAMKASVAPSRVRRDDHAGIGLAVGQRRLDAAGRRAAASLAPSARIGLQWRY